LAEPRLPLVVQQQGITVAKATKNFLLAIGFVSTDDQLNAIDLGDFIESTVQDPISRTSGVGDFQLFGAQYAMRIWLDPAKLNNFGLTPGDVSAAVRAQNVQLAAGELGGLPASMISSSTRPSSALPTSRSPSSSARSCCAYSRAAPRCCCVTWLRSNSAVRTIRRFPNITAILQRPSPSSWPAAPMRSTP